MNAGLARSIAADLRFAKGAHLGAGHGELRPVSLLSRDRGIRCLLDFGKRQRMRPIKAITRRLRLARALRHGTHRERPRLLQGGAAAGKVRYRIRAEESPAVVAAAVALR